MPSAQQPHLLLIGGGHSHALVLAQLTRTPFAGTRITLVSDGRFTPYSGMLPGLIAGHYRFAQAHIDLATLCAGAGVAFIEDRLTALDPASRQVYLQGGEHLTYDLLSLDTGSTPRLDVPGAQARAWPVKPVAGFLERLERLESHWRNAPPTRAWQLVSVGGGPSSLEVLLALQHRFATPVHGAPATHVHAHLLYPGNTPLPDYPLRVQRRVRALLAERGVQLHEGFRVAQVEAAHLLAADDRTLPYDQLIWATSAEAPDWAAQAGLATDAAGFIRVDPYLRSLSHPTIFASGDLAALPGPPHPKSGVLAVRQGPILFHNLRGACLGQPLRAYQAQARILSLISTGHRHALATRGDWLLEGGWVWRWKDWIDRRFMAQFAKGERPY